MPRHSNTLVFATNTAVALDISGSPTSGTPSITLGYKRQEAAWVPLLANETSAGNYPGNCGSSGNTPCMFTGSEGTTVTDAYSVIATFSGDVSAKGDAAASGSGSIAQFFATGLAARKLAETGGARLVNTAALSPADQVIMEQWHAQNVEEIDAIAVKLPDDDAGFKAARDPMVQKSSLNGKPAGVALLAITTKKEFLAYLQNNKPLIHPLAVSK